VLSAISSILQAVGTGEAEVKRVREALRGSLWMSVSVSTVDLKDRTIFILMSWERVCRYVEHTTTTHKLPTNADKKDTQFVATEKEKSVLSPTIFDVYVQDTYHFFVSIVFFLYVCV
jgi:hypothetical protein